MDWGEPRSAPAPRCIVLQLLFTRMQCKKKLSNWDEIVHTWTMNLWCESSSLPKSLAFPLSSGVRSAVRLLNAFGGQSGVCISHSAPQKLFRKFSFAAERRKKNIENLGKICTFEKSCLLALNWSMTMIKKYHQTIFHFWLTPPTNNNSLHLSFCVVRWPFLSRNARFGSECQGNLKNTIGPISRFQETSFVSTA